MLNASLISMNAIASQLMLEQLARQYVMLPLPPERDFLETDEDADSILGWLKISEDAATEYEIEPAIARIEIIRKRLQKGLRISELATELRVLRETLQSGVKGQFLFRYPRDRKAVLENHKEDWKAVIKAFPSCSIDVTSGVDLWALGHCTASVFHFMRVLEHGLKALAQDVGKTFDSQNWQNIIDQIESEVRQQGKSLPAGSQKSERLRFLSTAAKEFVYFKDGWRNYVSHSRAFYDDSEAKNTMIHVLQFMSKLAERLQEV